MEKIYGPALEDDEYYTDRKPGYVVNFPNAS